MGSSSPNKGMKTPKKIFETTDPVIQFGGSMFFYLAHTSIDLPRSHLFGGLPRKRIGKIDDKNLSAFTVTNALNIKIQSYCWWLKSQTTTWDIWNSVKWWDKLPTSTGESRISEPSTVPPKVIGVFGMVWFWGVLPNLRSCLEVKSHFTWR